MNNYNLSPTDILRSRLNQETARLPFTELLRHFAAGSVVKISSELDLVDVAVQFSQDNKQQVADWMAAQKIQRAEDSDAEKWLAASQELWAVVVSPWVLVQEEKPKPSSNPALH